MPVTPELLQEIALSPQEYQLILQRLGREPNSVELGMFGSLWSEHCGYKHSKPLLKLFPSESSRSLIPEGGENAGVVDIGDGLAIVFKIESHNHPSAIEPLQGAATGVGGIVRDILAMGARPIALLNSLRFGPPEESYNQFLFEGVVAGISWYGNCIGIPNVGGEIAFSTTYSRNPLVNALCVGLVKTNQMLRASSGETGDLFILAGAETGRDGIHGASGLASRGFKFETESADEGNQEKRPAVQVGNPFLEKILIEACLEIAGTGTLEGLQDLGAAGLSGATLEAASRSGRGIELDLGKVPLRETGMSPYDILMSESQERMLLIVKPGSEYKAIDIFKKWDIPCAVIGRVTDDGVARISQNNQNVAELPISLLTNPPQYSPEGSKPQWLVDLQKFPLGGIQVPLESPGEILLRLLGCPNIRSKRYVFRQYDHQVQTNTVHGPGGDAALLRIKGTDKTIALSTDGNGRFCYLDPFEGGAIAVAEACRNVSCVGAEPIAITDCLNFGNPERPEVYYQLEQCIRGMAKACQVLGIPVVSGNVSLYNETETQSIWPTPVVGALGLQEGTDFSVTLSFRQEGDIVAMLGQNDFQGSIDHLAGTEYLELIHGYVAGRPSVDMALELKVQRFVRYLIRQQIIRSAHDCSDGGLAVTIAESCIAGNIGFRGSFPIRGRWDAVLFGESPSRIVISFPPNHVKELERMAREYNVPFAILGTVGGERLVIEEFIELTLPEIKKNWES